MHRYFKIRRLCDRVIDSIKTDTIWFPKARELNDPFDCWIEPYLVNNVTDNSELSLLLNKLENRVNVFRGICGPDYYSAKNNSEKNSIAHKNLCNKIGNVGLCSFLDEYDNILAWSHYGDEHKGVCIEFEKVGDHPEFTQQKNGFSMQKVIYSNEKPFIYWHEFLRAPELSLRLMFSTKFTSWSYENELRIIAFNKEGGYSVSLKDIGLRIKKVYKGCELQESDKSVELDSVCAEKGIEVCKLRKNAFEYSLKVAES